ncbi:MAG: hypothetical protein V4687_16015 [Bacteroidota bacterium]
MKVVIDYINCLLKPIAKNAEVNGLVEIVRKEKPPLPSGKFDYFPAKYFNNEYKKIEYGIYHRLIGKAKSVRDEENSSCGDEIYTKSFPMRLVAIIDKQGAKDDQYADLRIAEKLALNIGFDHNKALSIALFADSVYTEITSIETDRDAVFKREFSGDNFIDYNKTLIAIDYTIFINGNKVCLANCENSTPVIPSVKDYTSDYS